MANFLQRWQGRLFQAFGIHSKEVLAKIQEAEKRNLEELDLRDSHLTTLPESIT